jgi:protein gp37
VLNEWLVRIFETMRRSPQHQFQVLTKRATRMLEFLHRYYNREIASFPGRTPLPNVWLGVTIELDRYAWRADVLRQCPASVRFVSAEPLLGPLPSLDLRGIDWLITGGESDVHHRPLDLDWVRDLRDRCQAEGVAFFHKQNGGRTHAVGGRLLDGRTWDEFPVVMEPGNA